MPVQRCPLCLEIKNVVSSHLIPRAVYDCFRSDGGSPVRIADGVVFPTNRHIQDYLLCVACEDILNKGGEEWMAGKLCTWERVFPLHDLVVSKPPAHKDDDGGLYLTRANPEIDGEKLTHFAMGIFWRAAVHSWPCVFDRKRAGADPLIELGPFAKRVRVWLRGEDVFPKDMCLTVIVSPPERAQILINFPYEMNRKTWRTFAFHLPGVLFNVHVGRQIPMLERAFCFHENPDHPVLVSGQITRKIEQTNAERFRSSRKTQAYLKQKAKRGKVPKSEA